MAFIFPRLFPEAPSVTFISTFYCTKNSLLTEALKYPVLHPKMVATQKKYAKITHNVVTKFAKTQKTAAHFLPGSAQTLRIFSVPAHPPRGCWEHRSSLQ